MADLLAAFPVRPLHPRPPGLLRPMMRPVLGLLIFTSMLVGMPVWLAPTMVGDWQVRRTAVPIRGARVLNGSCDERLVLNLCDVAISAPLGAGTATRQASYMFASLDFGRRRARVVGDPARPDLMTTDMGLERFWNRVMCLAAATAALAALVAGAVLVIVKAVRTRRTWHRAEMVAVPLTLVTAGRRTWTMRTEQGREVRWVMSPFARPFVLGPADRVAGLSTRNGGSVMPLDSRLSWVVLTGAERRAIRAARKAAGRR